MGWKIMQGCKDSGKLVMMQGGKKGHHSRSRLSYLTDSGKISPTNSQLIGPKLTCRQAERSITTYPFIVQLLLVTHHFI